MSAKLTTITDKPSLRSESKSTNHLPENLDNVVDALCRNCDGGETSFLRGPRRQPLPSRKIIEEIIEELRSALFPGYFGTAELSKESMRFHVGATLDRVMRLLKEQIFRGLCFICPQDVNKCDDCEKRTVELSHRFFERLPEVQRILTTDVKATFDGDPAALSPDETVFSYPGLLAITNYRLAHELYLLNVPVIPRIITEHAHSQTGIDIHPGADIGEAFFIDHGTGVVIGETTVIGRNVRIYQGVTLGAKSFPVDEHGNPVKGMKRHPIVEDGVVIYSGATILGRVTIGKGTIVGGNVWLTHSVPPKSRISQARVRQDRFENGGGI
jgi:serine O-acetyltransferase